MANQSKFVTARKVDDPLVQDANYRFDEDDRQYIDNQIRGVQECLVEEVIPQLEDLGAEIDTDNGGVVQESVEQDNADGSATPIGTLYVVPLRTGVTVDVVAKFLPVGAATYKKFQIQRDFLNPSGTMIAGSQVDLLGPDTLGTANGASVAIEYTGTTVRVETSGQGRWRINRQIEFLAAAASAGAVPAAPTGISPSTGSTSGGTPVAITVPDSTDLTGAKVGGVALTSFAIVNGTTVSGTTGAHSAGAVDVVVSNASGDSAALAGGFTYTAAATLDSLLAAINATVYAKKGNYTRDGVTGDGTWPGRASGGTSATRDLAKTSTAPTETSGAPVFNGSGAILSHGDTMATVLTASAGTVICIFKPSAAAAPTGTPVNDPALFSDAGNGSFAFTYTTDGVGFKMAADGTYKGPSPIASAVNTAFFAAARWNGTNVKLRVNTTDATPATAGAVDGGMTGTVRVGSNYASTKFVAGEGRLFVVCPSELSDSQLTDLYNAAVAEGLLA